MIKTYRQHEQQNLTSNQVVSLKIPTGQMISNIVLAFRTAAGAAATEAEIRAEIARIRLTLDGVDLVNVPAARLYDGYEALGVKVANNTGVNGAVELNLGALMYVDPLNKQLTSIGTLDVASLQVQVTAGTLSAIASVQVYTRRLPINAPLGKHVRFLEFPVSFNATGENTYDTLPRDENMAYTMIMANPGASGTITTGQAIVDSAVIMEETPIFVNQLLVSEDGFTQPTGYFCYTFNDGLLSGELPMKGVRDFRLKTRFSVAPGANGYFFYTVSTHNGK